MSSPIIRWSKPPARNVEHLISDQIATLDAASVDRAQGACAGDHTFVVKRKLHGTQQRVMARMQLEKDLRAAVTGHQFELHYQPQIGCSSGAIVGAEALLRWPRPARTAIGPTEFMAVAEELRLGPQIGSRVLELEQACAQFACWQRDDILLGRLAVNVSASQLRDDFVDALTNILARYRIASSMLELEIVSNRW